MRLRETFAEIHSQDLVQNIRLLKSCVDPHRFFCPMVKADGYGHGDLETCRILDDEGVKWAGVSLIEEGIRLRTNGITARILTFAFFNKSGAEELIRLNITPALGSWDQIRHLESALRDGQSFPVHIKFNTGMNRLGFDQDEVGKVAEFFRTSSKFKVEGICTHLLQGEDAADPLGRTQEQIRRFNFIKHSFSGMNPFFHFQNSAALLQETDRLSGARPGLAIYGVEPIFSSETVEKNPRLAKLISQLRPAMTVKSSIGVVRHVKKGETVSYGGTWSAKKDSVIGVLPIGYEDGYFRQFSNRAHVLFRQQRVPVIGNVCMDYTMIDLTDAHQLGEPRVGEEVVLFGRQHAVEIKATELAQWAGTISYEILTSVSKRIPRIYV